MFLFINHFCLIWKSESVSFNQVVKEWKANFKIVDKFITEENAKSHFEYIYKPKIIKSDLTNFIVCDLETHNTDRGRPYVFCFYRLSKLAGRYNRDLTLDEIQKSKKDTTAFGGDNCVEKVLDFCLKLKKEYKEKSKVLEYNLQLHAHNESAFDTRIVIKNLPCDNRNVNIIKNGKGIIELIVFIGYIEKKSKLLNIFILDVV